VDETLIIEKLGPIGRLEIKPRPLTIIIGEQASGKSLVAQLLYFYRGLKFHLGRIYGPRLLEQEHWHERAMRYLLDSLRRVPFGHFAVGKASLTYQQASGQYGWRIQINSDDFNVELSDSLLDDMNEWSNKWQVDQEALAYDAQNENQIFIPTERSMISRFVDSQPTILYSDFQPEPVRRFSILLAGALRLLKLGHEELPEAVRGGLLKRTYDDMRDRLDKESFMKECQHRGLGGEAVLAKTIPARWQWRINLDGVVKELPIESIASGQMEAWPFFAVASTYHALGSNLDFYFEEPETHLHPQAQVEVMKVVAYLVNRGHSFVITTHSPYLLYVVNNMLQRFLTLKGEIPEGEEGWLDPEKVVAYRLSQDPAKEPQEILDRTDTNLIDAEELERVADELGGEFDELLYRMD